MPNAEIVSIGSELLLGQIVDTNAAWVASRLTGLGVNLFYKTVVGDNAERMVEVIDRALNRSDIVITGGGLGPTQDDITRQVISDVTNRKLIMDSRLIEQIQSRFQDRGLITTPNNLRQAYIPEGAIVIDNPNGTAPSFIVETERGIIFALPGVPFELKWLFDNEVTPYLLNRFNLSETIKYRVLKVADIGESRVDDLIGHLITNSANPTVGVLAHPGQVDVRIAAKASSTEKAMDLIANTETEVRNLLDPHIFAIDDETMEDAVGILLNKNKSSVAVYEDITGGLLSDRLHQSNTEQFLESTVSNGLSCMSRLLKSSRYPNHVDSLLTDPQALVEELAWSVRTISESELGLAIHTIPDPKQDVENLGKGHTYISITNGSNFRNKQYPYGGRGRPDRLRMSLNAMNQLRLALIENFV